MEGNTVHLAVLADLDDFGTAGDQLVDSLNGNRGVRGVLVAQQRPYCSNLAIFGAFPVTVEKSETVSLPDVAVP